MGDRYFDHRPDFKGQITFFALEHLVGMWEELAVPEPWRDPSAPRRNVIVEGTDLNAWIGQEFELQGLRFFGTEECSPCYWMNQVIHPRAEAWMKGRGGLRAQIIQGGHLTVEPVLPGPPLASILLVGGSSQRMGRDKALIEIQGQPLWMRQIRLLRALFGPVAISARTRPTWLPDSVAWVPDAPGNLGPLGGLLSALEWAQDRGATRALALAVDLPKMRIEPLRELLAACKPDQGAIPQTNSHFEPLAAVYPTAALPLVKQAVQAGQLKLQTLAARLIEAHLLAPIAVSHPACFDNMNHPEDIPP